MAIIYKNFEPTNYVMIVKKGKVIQQGVGLSFFYNTLATSVVVLPTTAYDDSFAFENVMTCDFQTVNVQGDISYAIADYEKAAKMVDFSYKNIKKEDQVTMLAAKQKMSKRILNLAKVYITKFISNMDIRSAIVSSDQLAKSINESLKNDKTLKEFGLELISISILGIMANADTQKALEAAAREEILKQQDDAIYKRRNSAIEQERIVKENELNTEIKVAEKQQQKQEKEMETKRIIQEKQAELNAINLQNNINLEEENKKLVDLKTENARKLSDAKAYDLQVVLKTYTTVDIEIVKALAATGMDSKALIAKAFLEIGNNADKIGTLNVSPDLLETLTNTRG